MKQIKDIFSLILKQIPDLVTFVLDKDGNFLVYSDVFKRVVKKLWGEDIEEGSNFFEAITYEEDLQLIKKEFNRAISGEIFTTIQQVGAIDLTRKYFTSKWSPLIKNDEIIGTICTVSETIKSSIQIEGAFDCEDMFQMFFDLSSDGLICTQFKEPVKCDVALIDDDAIIKMLKNEIVVYANQTMIQQLQASEANVIGKNLLDLLDYPRENLIRYYKEVLTNKRITIKTSERGNEGKGIWIEGSYITISNAKNEIVGHFGSRRDITKKVEIEQAFKQTEYLLNYIVEHDRTAVAVFDKDYKYIYVSQKYRDDFALGHKALIGEKHYDIFPFTNKYWEEIHKRALLGETLQKDEDSFIAANGEKIWTRWLCSPWYDLNKEIAGIVFYVEKINEEKEIRMTLRENELRLNALFSQAAIGISYGPLQYEFKQVNKKLCDITGYSSDELTHLSYLDLGHPVDIELYQRNKLKLVNGEIDDFTMENRLIRENNEIIWANITYSIIDSEEIEEPYVLMIFEDITHRKQIEEKMVYLSYHDQLTGLYNRRFYEEELSRLDTSRNLPISLVVADANGLKLINDAFGHVQGDKLIQSIASVLLEECRSDDIIARIGGDEFVILLLNTDKEESKKIMKRINDSLANRHINEAPITMALGVATKIESTENIIDVFNEAEAMMYRKKLDYRSETMNETIQVILDTFFKQNEHERSHAHRVSGMCYKVGQHMNLETNQLEKLKVAGLMHDIGKVNIPNSILNKVTKLTKHEWDDIMRHSETGYRILSAVSEFAEVSRFVLAHHERWDGTGYPKGLRKEEIPLESRIISVVDAYDTMINVSTYGKSYTVETALEELRNMAGTQFDPSVVEIFIREKIHHIEA